MSNEENSDEKATTPIPWGEDPFGGVVGGPKDGDLADLAPFMEANVEQFDDGNVRPGNPSELISGRYATNGTTPFSSYRPIYGVGLESNPSSEFPVGFGGDVGSRGDESKTKKRSRSSRSEAPPSTSSSSRRKKKPKGVPKRPLSAYNLYFQSERAKMMDDADKGLCERIGFEDLGKIIGSRWRALSSSKRKGYEELAEKDSDRYRREMDNYNQKKREEKKMIDDAKDAAAIAAVTADDPYCFDGILNAAGPQHQTQKQELTVAVAIGDSSSNRQISSSAIDVHDGRDRASPPPSPQTVEGGGSSLVSFNPAKVQQMMGYCHPHDQPQQDQQTRTPYGASFGPSSAAAEQRHELHGGMAECSPARLQRPQPTHVSVPPPPSPCFDAVRVPLPPGQLPVPAGMEIVLPDNDGIDRKYRIQYTCFSMTREAASKYVESVTGVPPSFTPNTTTSDFGPSNAAVAQYGGSNVSAFALPPTRQLQQHFAGGYVRFN